jgi:uncharacterized RDD family membrane protein YckC
MTAASRRARAGLIRGRRAGLVSRILAGVVDLTVTAVILFSILVGFAVVRYMVGSAPLQLPRVSGIFTAAAFPLVEFLYLSVMWSASGRSVGKQLVGLRAVKADGARLGVLQASARALFCTIIGGLSLLWSAFSKRNAAVHDLVLQTAVVHDWSDEVRSSPEAQETLALPAAGDVRLTART